MTAAPKIRTGDHRKAIPVGVKLQACMLLLGFTRDEIDTAGAIVWDHNPSLVNRPFDNATGDWLPGQLDPAHIQPLRKSAHDVKTWGAGGALRISNRGSDISEPIRTRKIAAKHAEFQARMLAPKQPKAERERKSKFPSRPFPKKAKK